MNRIEQGLREIGREYVPPVGWQQRVLRAIAVPRRHALPVAMYLLAFVVLSIALIVGVFAVLGIL